MNRTILTVFLAATAICFFIFPDVVSEGAKNGLLLWFDTVLPALLPFMIVSDFMIRQRITEGISRFAYPFFHYFFGVSRAGAYPAVIGLLSGYPVGAKAAAQLYREQMISKEEAQCLLTFCNNASPMFLLEYIGIHCMRLPYPAALLLVIDLSAFLTGMFFQRKSCLRAFPECAKGKTACSRRQSVIRSLDESILDAFVTITKVGGYIILFSIAAQIFSELLPFPDTVRYIGIGILEITTGGEALSYAEMPESMLHGILTGLCAFGGLSSVAQTASVLGESDLSVGNYVLAKLCQAGIAAAIAVLVSVF